MACNEDVTEKNSLELHGKRVCVPCSYSRVSQNGDSPKEYLVDLIEHIHDQLLNADLNFDQTLTQGAKAVTRYSDLEVARETLATLMWIERALQERKSKLIDKIVQLETA